MSTLGGASSAGSGPFYHHFSKRTLTRAQTVDRALVCALREEQGSILQNGYELSLREGDRKQHQRDRDTGSRFQGFVRGKSNQTYSTEVAVDQANMHGKSNQGLFDSNEPKPYKHQFRADPRKGAWGRVNATPLHSTPPHRLAHALKSRTDPTITRNPATILQVRNLGGTCRGATRRPRPKRSSQRYYQRMASIGICFRALVVSSSTGSSVDPLIR